VVLNVDAWRSLVHTHAAVFVHPTYNCLTGDGVPQLSEISTELQMLASERALPINGTYSARATRDCAAEEQAWPTLAAEPGALYVLLPQAMALAERFAAAGVHCAVFDRGRVCSTDSAAIIAAITGGIVRP